MLIILNGISRKRDKFNRDFFPTLQKEFNASIITTEYSGHAEEIARAASLRAMPDGRQGEDIILAAGGDGTMSQVVNGVMSSGSPTIPVVGLIPLGSGNDLARSLGVKPDVNHVVSLIRKNEPRTVDVGTVELTWNDGKSVSRYFINECSVGMGPEVVRRVNESSAVYGASINYLKSIIATFLTHKPEPVWVKANDFEWSGDARVLAVANGRAFGHSIYIAPDAQMDDSKLNLFLVKGLPLLKFLVYLQIVKQPKKVNDRKWIEYRTLENIEIGSSRVLPVEADGELIGFTPLKCSLASGKLRILA